MASFIFDSSTLRKVIDAHADTIQKSTCINAFYVTSSQKNELKKIAKGTSSFAGAFQEVTYDAGNPDGASYQHILSILNDAEENPDNKDNSLLVDMCLLNGYTLVTENRHLAETAWKYGARVNNIREFIKALKMTA